jgi:Cu/Ag efflux protein CusF
MKSKATFSAVIFLVSGCSVYEMPALNRDHPASLLGMSAPQRSISKTLAYTREDMPFVASAAAQATHEDHHPASESGGQKTAAGDGKVIAIVPGSNQIVIEHGEIKGFMEAMTMGYSVDPSSLVEGLKPGDRVRFTIDVPKKSIIKIEKLT